MTLTLASAHDRLSPAGYRSPLKPTEDSACSTSFRTRLRIAVTKIKLPLNPPQCTGSFCFIRATLPLADRNKPPRNGTSDDDEVMKTWPRFTAKIRSRGCPHSITTHLHQYGWMVSFSLVQLL